MGRFTDLYGNAFKKYADFSGRACRAEALAFMLTNGIILTPISWIVTFMLIGGLAAEEGSVIGLAVILSLILTIVSLALLVPSWALGARRLHDLNQSGWWQALIYLLFFIPVINYVAWVVPIVVFYCLPGTEGDNDYGPVSDKY